MRHHIVDTGSLLEACCRRLQSMPVVAIDTELRDAILNACPQAQRDSTSHMAEHSLELQLPFIQVRNASARIVPILVATADAGALESLGAACASAMMERGEDRPLIVASSDMTHYESAESAQQKDQLAIEKVKDIDGAGLVEVVRGNSISMCGVAPTAAMLFAAKRIGPARGELIAYGTSGDVTGDNTQVVAYAAAAVRAA